MTADTHSADTTITTAAMEEESSSHRGKRPSLIGHLAQGPALSAYTISSEGTLLPAELKDVLQTNLNGENDAEKALPPVVLDANIRNDNDLALLRKQVLDKWSLPALMTRHLTMKQLQTPQVLALSRATLVVIRTLPVMSDSLAQARNAYHSAALCYEGETLLLMNIMPAQNEQSSIHKQARTRNLENDAVSLMCRRESLPSASISGALGVWLCFHLGQVTTATHKLRSRVFDMSESTDDDINSVTLSDIVEAKDCFLRLYSGMYFCTVLSTSWYICFCRSQVLSSVHGSRFLL